MFLPASVLSGILRASGLLLAFVGVALLVTSQPQPDWIRPLTGFVWVVVGMAWTFRKRADLVWVALGGLTIGSFATALALIIAAGQPPLNAPVNTLGYSAVSFALLIWFVLFRRQFD